MFSSNPSPQISSSSNVFSPPDSFFDYENVNIDFNYCHQINDPFSLFPPPVTHDVFHHQFSEDHYNQPLDSVIMSSHKNEIVTTKKDGPRSKIYTTRGPKDRRVRLSIDISRKFFCLQDLLGFDKASRTLDWLLTKSLTAIKDLVDCSSSTVVTDESKAEFLETIKRDSDHEDDGEKRKSILKFVDRKGKKVLTQRSKKVRSLENFSRIEARARARERTKQKNLVKKFDDSCDQSAGQFELQNGYYKDIDPLGVRV